MRNARSGACGDAIEQEIAHLGEHIAILGCLLHGARLALHVHQAHRQPTRSHDLQRTGAPQRPHVVDHPGTERRDFAHHAR